MRLLTLHLFLSAADKCGKIQKMVKKLLNILREEVNRNTTAHSIISINYLYKHLHELNLWSRSCGESPPPPPPQNVLISTWSPPRCCALLHFYSISCRKVQLWWGENKTRLNVTSQSWVVEERKKILRFQDTGTQSRLELTYSLYLKLELGSSGKG